MQVFVMVLPTRRGRPILSSICTRLQGLTPNLCCLFSFVLLMLSYPALYFNVDLFLKRTETVTTGLREPSKKEVHAFTAGKLDPHAAASRISLSTPPSEYKTACMLPNSNQDVHILLGTRHATPSHRIISRSALITVFFFAP